MPELLTSDQMAQRVVQELADGMYVNLGFGVMMSNVSKRGEPKRVERCNLPLTGRRCVDLVVTDVAVVEVTHGGFLLRELAPGWTADAVAALTEAPLAIGPELREMRLKE